MNVIEQYNELTLKLKQNLPLKALPIRDLVQVFRKKGHHITQETILTITDVHNSGDVSGIMCLVRDEKEYEMACALTHLVFLPQTPLFKEIKDYQEKREARIMKLREAGLNYRNSLN